MQTTGKSALAQLHSCKSTIVKRIHRRLKDAQTYVGTDELSGEIQCELLKREECTPSSKVLEVGCGCLHAGVPLMRFLDRGNFVGIEPNVWLLQAAVKQLHVRRLIKGKNPKFLAVTDFDASSLGTKFDLVLSHSILSHAAHWQLDQFLRNTSAVLESGGRILASIRLAEGNEYGSSGATNREDSRDEAWVYPGVSWFKLSTVHETAARLGLGATNKPEYTEFYTKQRAMEYHDWFVFSRA